MDWTRTIGATPKRHSWWKFAAFLSVPCGWGCEPAPAPAVVSSPPAVKVTAVTRSDATRALRLSGTLEAERSLSLSFAVVGTIEQVLVQEGQAVKGGQVVAKISGRSYQDALGIAQVKANQADDAYRRLKPMADNKTLPEIKMVEVESGREQARLLVSMAAKNVQDTVLRSPEAGIVARRFAEPGTSAAPGAPVITIVQTKTMLATAPVPETQVSRVKKGDPAQVFVSALGQSFGGTVREIGVVADPLTRTYSVKVAVANPQAVLRIGMVADVTLQQENKTRDWVVPPEAVRVDEQGNPYVFVVTDGSIVQQRKVKVAGYAGEGTAISEGLSDKDGAVVTSGTPMLADGMRVRIVERQAGAK